MTTTLLLLLDVLPGLATEDWVQEPIPPENRIVLTETGFERPEPGVALDWLQIGSAVERLADHASERLAATSDSVTIYVGGQAPLFAFAHLGYRLSKFVGKQIFLGVRPTGGVIEAFDLTLAADGVEFFANGSAVPSYPPAFGTGLLALFVDCADRTTPTDAIADALRSTGQSVLDLVERRTEGAKVIDSTSAPQVALELTQLLSTLPSRYPKSDGLALFLAGPTLLAFLVGRALNPSLVGKVLLTNFVNRAYQTAYSLPFERPVIETIDRSPEAQLRRHKAKTKIVTAIHDLKSVLTAEDMAADPLLAASDAPAIIQQLSSLKVSDKDGDEFSLSLAQGELSLGEPLIEAISNLDDEKISDLAKLFVLHELVHDVQGLRTTNFRGVGRAAVALEQVDYLADAFSLRTLMHIEARRGGDKAREQAAVRRYGVRLVDTILSGIEAFDSMDHGARIERLTERRVRRYLIWHLQRARATSLLDTSNFDQMLGERVAVELAPLMGRIDLRAHEKVVTRPTPTTSLFIALDGRLIRVAASHDFEPAAVLEALRTFGRTPLEKLMNFVLEENRKLLAPWRS
jgi:hypothetical protein